MKTVTIIDNQVVCECMGKETAHKLFGHDFTVDCVYSLAAQTTTTSHELVFKLSFVITLW